MIKNSINGKRYVGSAECFRVRWKLHRSQLNGGRHHSQKLQRAWEKYGRASFEFTILEEVDVANLIEREQYWLDKLRAVKVGYNVAPNAGSSLGLKRSYATRRKMVAIREAFPISAEQHERMAEARRKSPKFGAHVKQLHQNNIGRKQSPATLEKLAVASSLRWQDPQYRQNMVEKNTGRHHTKEARKKISAAKAGKSLSEIHRSRLSESHKGIQPSPETRAKQSAAQKARRAREQLEAERLPIPMRKRKSKTVSLSKEHLLKMEAGRRNSPKFAKHLDNLHKLAKGRKHTDEAKQRMSVAISAALQNPVIRAQISAATKGRKVSEATRERMRVAAIAREARKRDATT